MGIDSEPIKDVYRGLKEEFKTSPWTVGSVLCLWGVAWTVYFFVYPTLARTTDIQPITDQVQTIEVKMLDREILSVVTQRCSASQKRFLSERLQTLLLDYELKVGKPYPPLPSCEDLR